jgi:hypothetical protein
MRKYIRRLFRRMLLLAARLMPPRSPWERIVMNVPVAAFGPGSKQRFTHYFEGESSVRVESIDDIALWLLECEYATDTDLFQHGDVWQHPTAFEQLRRGDCEDFALWTWRKLAEIGIEAEFCVGRTLWGEARDVDRRHAWVVYRVGEAEFLFEPAAGKKEQMIRQLAEVMDQYVPHFAVNGRLRTSAFGGYVLDSRRRRRGPVERELPEPRLEPSVLRKS